MTWEQVDQNAALEAAKEIKYRNQDIKEALDYGCKSVFGCYEAVKDRHTRWFLIKDGTTVVAPIALKRDGYLTFFVNRDLAPEKALAFIRALRDIAKWYTDNYETTIFVKTANWYKEAQRINKLVGFKPYILTNKTTIWVYEAKR
jgi:hypothetical protein